MVAYTKPPKLPKKNSTNSFRRDIGHENKSSNQNLVKKNSSKENLSHEKNTNKTSAFNLRKSNKSLSLIKNSPSMPPKPVRNLHLRNNSTRNASTS